MYIYTYLHSFADALFILLMALLYLLAFYSLHLTGLATENYLSSHIIHVFVYMHMTLIIMWYQRVCNCRQYCFDQRERERGREGERERESVHAFTQTYGVYLSSRIHVHVVECSVWCRGFESHPRQLIFLRKSHYLGCAVLLCFVCLFDLACFFLSSFSSLIKTCTAVHVYVHLYVHACFIRTSIWSFKIPVHVYTCGQALYIILSYNSCLIAMALEEAPQSVLVQTCTAAVWHGAAAVVCVLVTVITPVHCGLHKPTRDRCALQALSVCIYTCIVCTSSYTYLHTESIVSLFIMLQCM